MNTPEVQRGEAPWAVLLKFAEKWNPTLNQTKQFKESRVLCSGTLISSRHVLTAAHCFGPIIESICGVKNQTNGTKPEGQKAKLDFFMTFHRRNLERTLIVAPDRCVDQTCDSHVNSNGVEINKVFLSSEFVLADCLPRIYEQFSGDIAVIELAEDVTFSRTVQPACLPDTFGLDVGENLTMYGYGMNHEMPPVVGILRRHEATVQECLEIQDSNLACSNHPTAMACSGDSGSGQIVFDNGTAHVAAVMVGGKPCWLVHQARKEDVQVTVQDINVVVAQHADWICKVSGICRGPERTVLNLKWTIAQILVPKLADIDEPARYLSLEKLTGDDIYA